VTRPRGTEIHPAAGGTPYYEGQNNTTGIKPPPRHQHSLINSYYKTKRRKSSSSCISLSSKSRATSVFHKRRPELFRTAMHRQGDFIPSNLHNVYQKVIRSSRSFLPLEDKTGLSLCHPPFFPRGGGNCVLSTRVAASYFGFRDIYFFGVNRKIKEGLLKSTYTAPSGPALTLRILPMPFTRVSW